MNELRSRWPIVLVDMVPAKTLPHAAGPFRFPFLCLPISHVRVCRSHRIISRMRCPRNPPSSILRPLHPKVARFRRWRPLSSCPPPLRPQTTHRRPRTPARHPHPIHLQPASGRTIRFRSMQCLSTSDRELLAGEVVSE